MKTIQVEIALAAVALTLTAMSSSRAQQTEELVIGNYDIPGVPTKRTLEAQHAEERIDPYTGKVQWHFLDFSISGNGGFDLNVQRSYNSLGPSIAEPAPFGLGWTVHFGRLFVASALDDLQLRRDGARVAGWQPSESESRGRLDSGSAGPDHHELLQRALYVRRSRPRGPDLAERDDL